MTLDSVIMSIESEHELQILLKHESENLKRFNVAMRLYHRYSKIRRNREHKELHNSCQN